MVRWGFYIKESFFFLHSGQQFAQQMQQQNPELIEQLRSQIRSRPPSASNEEQWHLKRLEFLISD